MANNAALQEGRREMTVYLPPGGLEELEDLAKVSGYDMAELVELAFGLVYLAINHALQGNHIEVWTASGRSLKKIVLPIRKSSE